MADLPPSVRAILQDRFYHPHESEWVDVCERNARAWARTPQEVGEFYLMMRNRRGLPNTPALANAGRKHNMASACFVLPIEDSLTSGPGSIMQTLKDAAAVHQSGGGTGFSGARIRGRGELVNSTGRPAPGAVNVLELYSDAIARVTQAGMRNGANMFILPDNHPDVMEFVNCKRHSEDKITNFNISVGASDALMQTMANYDQLCYEAGSDRHWRAERELWDAIIEGMWENGEPGLWFQDTTNRKRLHPELFEATNPCGEVPLLPYEACVLGSVNLSAHVICDRTTGYEPDFDWDMYEGTIRTMTRLLDNIIDKQHYPIPEIEEGQKRYRKIGVNPMGFADMLVKLGIKYGSNRSVSIAHNLAHRMQEVTYDESAKLAAELGPYAGHPSQDEGVLVRFPSDRDNMPFRRNLCTMVGAPTGTVSRLALCSAAIEPHPDVNEAGAYMSYIVGGAFTDHVYVDHESEYFTPTSDVTLSEHIKMQSAWQDFTDQAISKTINCPESTTRQELSEAVIGAWQSGCKGVTVLRHGSREKVVLGDCNGAACSVVQSEHEQLVLEAA